MKRRHLIAAITLALTAAIVFWVFFAHAQCAPNDLACANYM